MNTRSAGFSLLHTWNNRIAALRDTVKLFDIARPMDFLPPSGIQRKHSMSNVIPDFEPSASWCYRFSRYKAIPEILQMPEAREGKPFRLIDLTWRVLKEHLTREQLAMTFKRREADGELSVAASIKFYIPFIAKNTGQLKNIGGGQGLYCLPSSKDVDEEATEAEAGAIEEADEAAEAEDSGTDLSGWIYAFSFPLIQRSDGPFPIKVGKTAGDVENRVSTQCRQSSSFEQPTILGKWKALRMTWMEQAIHSHLKAKGKWRENAPGIEWFDTTVDEIEKIIRFIEQD